jgi:hypothetical protein
MKKAEEYDKAMDDVIQSFTNFQSQAGNLIKLVADNGEESEGVSTLFALRAFTKDGDSAAYGEDQQYYDTIAAAQKKAVESQKNYDSLEKELLEKKAEYSDAVSDRTS